MAMIVERSMSDGFLTNTYLVAAGPNSDAFLVDAGGPIPGNGDSITQRMGSALSAKFVEVSASIK
jgi:hypothetical protein